MEAVFVHRLVFLHRFGERIDQGPISGAFGEFRFGADASVMGWMDTSRHFEAGARSRVKPPGQGA